MTTTDSSTYRLAAALVIAAGFFLAWVSLGVGVIGRDGDPANFLYAGVIAVGIIGARTARGEPRRMALAPAAMALGQTIIAAIALILRLGEPWSGPLEIVLLNGFFVALFLASALLFRAAARGGTPSPATPRS